MAKFARSAVGVIMPENDTKATEADIVKRLRAGHIHSVTLDAMAARIGHPGFPREGCIECEAADRIEYLEKREAYLVAELNACTNVPNGDKG
jgi:hypothetical protein